MERERKKYSEREEGREGRLKLINSLPLLIIVFYLELCADLMVSVAARRSILPRRRPKNLRRRCGAESTAG